jgi:outer membrane protein assembly factor BamB
MKTQRIEDRWTAIVLRIVAITSATLGVAFPAPGPANGQWPGWLGPNRDGHSADTGLLKQWPEEGPKLLWKVDSLGAGWSSVAVANDRVYITGTPGEMQVLFCFDLDGKEQWKVEQGPKCSHGKYFGSRSTPTVDGDRIYVTAGDGLVTCHAAADGKILWKRDMIGDLGGKVGGWRYGESVLILDQWAIVTPGGKQAIVALDKTTGEDVWKSDLSATAGYSSCITLRDGDNTLIVNGSQSGLLAVDAKTGEKVWTHDFASPNTANVPTPAFADGHLFWAVGYGKGGICFRVSHTEGQWRFEEAWRTTDLNCHPGNYVVAQGQIYGKGKGGLACLDLKTGETLWTARGIPAGQVSWADGLLYAFADSRGIATLVEPTDAGGNAVGRIQVEGEGSSWAYPVVAGGRLYLRYDTNLYCYDVRANVFLDPK